MQLVPFTSDYDQTFTTTLDGVGYTIDARWNERGQVWTMDITREADQVMLVAGVPLLSGQDVIAPYALGIGGLVIADLSNNATDPGPDDFGDRAVAFFLTNDELALLAEAGVAGIVIATAPQGEFVPTPSSPAAPTPPTTGGSSGSGSGTTTVINNTIINQNVTSVTNVGGGFGASNAQNETDGVETLEYIFLYNAAANPSSTLLLSLLVLATGPGTIRVYVGGIFEDFGFTGTPSGTLVGSVVAGGSKAAYVVLGAPIANPGGVIPVKVTQQASSPPTPITVWSTSGNIS